MKRRLNGIAAYEYWVLRALSNSGDSAMLPQVYRVIWEKMRNQFGPHELAMTEGPNPEPRWENETRQARRNLVKVNDGRMEPSEEDGTWKISEKGETWLRENPTPPSLNSLNSLLVDDGDLDCDV
jgi:hypothetical protein